MGPGFASVTPQRYEATGTVRAGGEGRLDAHGLAAPFDGTAGRIDELPGPADVLCAALSACILKNVERIELLHRNIRKFGTITNTLGKACDLSGTIRAIATPS